MTTLSLETGRHIGMSEAEPLLLDALADALDGRMIVADHTFASAPDPTKVDNARRRKRDQRN